MDSKECAICYKNLGNIYRTLHCGHKFHHKCLILNEKYNNSECICPYCRQTYENIKLRDRTYKLSIEEEKNKKMFSDQIKSLLVEIQNEDNKSKKFEFTIKIYEIILKNIKMLNQTKYGFREHFLNVIINKIHHIQNQIDDIKLEKGVDFIGGQEKYDYWICCKENVLKKINL